MEYTYLIKIKGTLKYRINKQDGISTQGGANHEKQISEQDQINDQGGEKSKFIKGTQALLPSFQSQQKEEKFTNNFC